MSLQGAIIQLIPPGGCTLKILRERLCDEPQAIDAALLGLRAAGRIRVVLGAVSVPGKSAVPLPVGPKTNRKPPVAAEDRAARKRAYDALWRERNRERRRAYNNNWMALQRRRQSVIGRGGYAAQRIRQIEEEGG